MKLSTRIAIVGFTLGSCALAALLQFQEKAGYGAPAPFELFDAIQTQLMAIRTQRYQQAYLQASSQYIDNTDMERFIESARGSAAIVRQAVRWEFGIVDVSDNYAVVPVRFFLSTGGVQPSTYRLVRENKVWKIDGTQLDPIEHPRAVAGMRL